MVNANTDSNSLTDARLDELEKQLNKASKRSSNQFQNMPAETESFDQGNIGAL